MIDTLFGSKTRVKLLHLFFNHPEQSFYVREITRIIGEQINSVRRELSNMLSIGVISSESSDNKLFYKVDQNYNYFLPLKDIFGDSKLIKKAASSRLNSDKSINYDVLKSVSGIRVLIASGTLVEGSKSPVDLLIAGSDSVKTKSQSFIKQLEKREGRDLNYSIINYDEFYYRLSIRDKFIMSIIDDKHVVIIDEDKILK